jgi:hypothetical protein
MKYNSQITWSSNWTWSMFSKTVHHTKTGAWQKLLGSSGQCGVTYFVRGTGLFSFEGIDSRRKTWRFITADIKVYLWTWFWVTLIYLVLTISIGKTFLRAILTFSSPPYKLIFSKRFPCQNSVCIHCLILITYPTHSNILGFTIKRTIIDSYKSRSSLVYTILN